MAVIFNQAVKHDRHQFFPGVAVAFDDANAENYFVAAGWAVATEETPVFVYPEGSVEIDTDAVFAETGRKVLEV